LGTTKSTESDVFYFELDVVFNREPVELLEESMWTAGFRRTGNNTGEEVLCFLEFGDVRKPPCQKPATFDRPFQYNISGL